MAEIVNLRQVRKRKARNEAARQAEENRDRFGRTKAEKQTGQSADEKLNRHLDGHKRDGRDEI